MVMHSRDPALLFPDEKKVVRNSCAHVLPGGCDCQNQVSKNNCVFQKEKNTADTRCAGRTGAAGADVEKGKNFVALERLEKYRSTEKGLGHLSNTRAVHSSPVPFHE